MQRFILVLLQAYLIILTACANLADFESITKSNASSGYNMFFARRHEPNLGGIIPKNIVTLKCED